MSYALAADVGVKLGPVMIETLFKYAVSQKGDHFQAKDEILFDQAFSIVKTFMQTSTKHTVEELQQFSNQRIPVPPWVHAPRVIIPMSVCQVAAEHLIRVLGGDEMCRKLVGGTKWWQVRGVQGVHGQWIAARKDWEDAKQKRKEYEARDKSKMQDEPEVEHQYHPEMDQMRCMLFAHGGGYFFGSIDQERYCMQRYARKMKGRVFAVGYRLAPQYPFPCAIQDALAAYLYLIDPPPGAEHLPVPPSMIILGGSSAGGGLMLALLQVIRDAGLPLPAGAVLISPWCDLTHSFPSIHENTATDVVPTTGLSFLKPSALWPPPSEDTHASVRDGLRERLRRLMHRGGESPTSPAEEPLPASSLFQSSMPARSLRHIRHARSESDLGITDEDKTHVAGDIPGLGAGGRITVQVEGKKIDIDTQIHLYCPNHLMKHPLVSPIISDLSGLPPLFFIASDKEVLRDEIIFMAHRAARPDKYPVDEEAKKLYPPLAKLENKPVEVHLQVYDDTCHVLPLFSFTTPAKFCYRAIATFCKHVVPDRTRSASSSPPISPPLQPTLTAEPLVETPAGEASLSVLTQEMSAVHEIESPVAQSTDGAGQHHALSAAIKATPDKLSSKRGLTHPANLLRRLSVGAVPVRRSVSLLDSKKEKGAKHTGRADSGDVAGPRLGDEHPAPPGARLAGDPVVYANREANPLCERVSALGEVRMLEDESEVAALCFPLDRVGVISEASAKRYIEARVAFDRRFSGAAKGVQRTRSKLLSKAASKQEKRVIQHLVTSPTQTLLLPVNNMSPWYFDTHETPPVGSLVARRDTAEARRLGMIADQSLSQHETRMSGNSLWAAVANFLSTSPERGEAKTNSDRSASPTTPTSPTAAQQVNEDNKLVAAETAVPGYDANMPPADGTRESRRSSSIQTIKSMFMRKPAAASAAHATPAM